MLIICIILYIILGLIIGTAVVSKENIKFFKHLKGESYNGFILDPMDLAYYIIGYYVLWPLLVLKFLWMNFWKYLFIMFQYTVKHILIGWEIVLYYFKTQFKEDLSKILKDKK